MTTSCPLIRAAFSSISTSKATGKYERVFWQNLVPSQVHSGTGDSSPTETRLRRNSERKMSSGVPSILAVSYSQYFPATSFKPHREFSVINNSQNIKPTKLQIAPKRSWNPCKTAKN